jgi:hypothetical protein
MRRFIKVGVLFDSNYGQLLTDGEVGSPFWVGMPTKEEFIDQFNNGVIVNSYDYRQMLACLRMVAFNDEQFANNNPDDSDYAH